MGAETVVEKVRAIAERVATGYGLEVFDVQFRREAPGMVLRVRIDRPGPASTEEDSVSVHDCSNVSRDLSAIFDVEEVLPTAYTLEVSSPGLDRPLRGRARCSNRERGRTQGGAESHSIATCRCSECHERSNCRGRVQLCRRLPRQSLCRAMARKRVQQAGPRRARPLDKTGST